MKNVSMLALAAAARAFALAPATLSQAGTHPHAQAQIVRGGFRSAQTPWRFRWPRDHASHSEFQSEWWYYTGHVTADDGRRFGYELTFFRIGLHPGDPKPSSVRSAWRGNEVFPAHFALTDERGQRFFYVDRFAREALGMGSASAATLDVRAEEWTLRGAPSRRPDIERMVLHASDPSSGGTNAIDLVEVPLKPPAVHGHAGVSRKGSCPSCASHYYSYTRLRTSGTLTLRGERLRVNGVSWMDHEFGSGELQREQLGWDWFSLQLNDGRELMLYLLRQRDGSVTAESSGSLIERSGAVRYLPRDAIHVEALAHWKSPHTGALYPSGWRVRVPSIGIDVVLRPAMLDQELAGTSAGGVSYWEGAVDVRDAAERRGLGVGYVELTGYAGAVSL